MNCGTCKYYVPPQKGDGIGTCHRNPPTAFMVPIQIPPSVGNPEGGKGIGIQAYFPPVEPELYCGAFVLKLVTAAN